MPSPFFRLSNPSGVLIADRKAFGINYLGEASLQSITQASGDPNTLAGRVTGYATYTFTSSSPIFPVLQLKSGCVVTLLDCSRSGSTWTIKVYCGDSSLDSSGFANQVSCRVFVFGRLTSGGGVGLKLRNDAGVLTHVYTDTAGPPLWVRGRLSEAGGVIDTSTARGIPSLSMPAAAGWPKHLKKFKSFSAGYWRNHQWQYGWAWNSGAPGQLALAEAKTLQFRDDAPDGTTKIVPSETLIINAALF